jgi:hypothetical protein
MATIFRGKLCGFICGETSEPLSNLIVRLYRHRDVQSLATLAVVNPKDTLAVLTEEQIKEKAAALLAETQTDGDGNFSFALGESERDDGEAFEIDVYCTTVPGLKEQPNPLRPLQFSITTLQPRWRETDAGLQADWDYCLPYRFWCAIRGYFGAWTICGRLSTCAAPKTPIAGATIRAFDTDLLQDDYLGEAVTGLDGRFRIDYTSSQFKVTPFSPLINVEFTSGPDLYFTAELGGVKILDEPRLTGRTPSRSNVAPCFCVDLCTDQVRPPDVEQIPHWQQVEVFDIHPFPSASGFSAEGYAGGASASLVFGGGVSLKGNCPLRNAAAPANPLEYRFQIGEWTWPGAVEDPSAIPTVPPASLVPVTQIESTRIGYIYYINGNGLSDSAPVFIEPADLAPGGWIRFDNKPVTVDMRDGTTSTQFVNNTNFLRTFDLLVLNTPAITSAHPPKLPGGLPIQEAGRSLLTSEREPIRRYRLSFEVRDGVSGTMVATDTLDSIVLDNSPVAVALDLEELRTNACSPVSGGKVHILYTVDHPHLKFFQLGISNNTGLVHPAPPLPSGAFVPPPPIANYLFRGGAGGPHQPSNTGGFPVTVSGDAPCAYRVAVTWQTRHYLSSAVSVDRLYCK